MVCASQMLEHLPYETALQAFAEMIRVSRRHVVISLPDARPVWQYRYHVPKFGTRFLLFPRPILKQLEHVFDGEHGRSTSRGMDRPGHQRFFMFFSYFKNGESVAFSEKTSVVIPAYRSEKTIQRTIRSAMESKGIGVDVIVVEDGVFDQTADRIRSLPFSINHVAFEKNQGAQRARNHGLGLVRTETVMFLDSDDYIDEQLLFALHKRLVETGAAMAFGPYRLESSTRSSSPITYPKLGETRYEVANRWLRGKSGPPPCSVMWSTSAVRAIGGWDERMVRNQDGEVVLRALRSGCAITSTLEGVGTYWHHQGERVSKRKSAESYTSQEIILEQMRSWNKTDQKACLSEAIASFCLQTALAAYRDKLHDVYTFWIQQWRQAGGTLRLSPNDFLSEKFKKIIFSSFGMDRGAALILLLRGIRGGFF